MLKEQIQVKFSFPPMSHFEDQEYIEFYGTEFSKLVQKNKEGNFELNQKIYKGQYFFEAEGFAADSSSIYLNENFTLIIKEKNRPILQECLDKEGVEVNKILRKIESKVNDFFLNFDYIKNTPDLFWKKLDLFFQQINRTLSFSNLDENFLKIQRKNLQYVKAHLAFIYLENYGIRFEWNEEIQDFEEKVLRKFTVSEKEKLESFINEKLKTEEEEIFFLGNHYKNFLETKFHLINEINDYDFINHINKVDKLFESQIIKDYYFFHITRKYFLEHASNKNLIRSNFEFYKQKNKNVFFEKHIDSFYKETLEVFKAEKNIEFDTKDINEKKVSLKGFEGKYIYVFFYNLDLEFKENSEINDELPFLSQFINFCKEKPIEFLGICINECKDRKHWKNFLKEQNLEGIHLMADENFYKSKFAKLFRINFASDFRAIFLDKQGQVLEIRAPFPSQEKEIKKLLNHFIL